jgi:hypothetical protein
MMLRFPAFEDDGTVACTSAIGPGSVKSPQVGQCHGSVLNRGRVMEKLGHGH